MEVDTVRMVSYARMSTLTQSDTISAQHDAVFSWAEFADHELVAQIADFRKSGRLPIDEPQGLLVVGNPPIPRTDPRPEFPLAPSP